MKQVFVSIIIITLVNTTTFAAFADILEMRAEPSNFFASPITTEIQEFVAGDGTADDRFGQSIAMDGDTAIIGASDDDDVALNSGSAYVFVKSGTTWTQQAKLTPSDPLASVSFGRAVAIDGDTAVIARSRGAGATDVAALYVFVRSGVTWTQQAKLVDAGQVAGSRFGESVDIDGDTVVGGSIFTTGTLTEGEAYVFVRSGVTWTQQATLNASDAATDDRFGSSVGVVGNTIAVGANSADVGAVLNAGVIYIFTRSGTTWTEQAILASDDMVAGAGFGQVLDLDGNTLATGLPFHNSAITNTGAVYVFTGSGATWTQQVKLESPEPTPSVNDRFGVRVGLDGDRLVVGEEFGDISGSGQGQLFVYERSGGVWTETRTLLASAGVNGDSLHRPAISGTTVLGAVPDREVTAFSATNRQSKKSNNLVGLDQGSVYVFNLLAPTAAGVNISGRVLSPNGRAIPRAIVHMTDQSGNIKTARTNMFGYYLLEDIEVGQTLVFNVYNKRYQFETQVVNLNTSLTGFDFIAQ